MNFNDLKECIEKSNNEFQLRSCLERYLHYKTNISGLWEEDRIDLLYKSVIIETKRYKYLDNSKNLTDAINNRIIPYMQNQLIKWGVLTDGKSMYFFKMDDNLNIERFDTGYGIQFNEANLEILENLIKDESPYISPKSLVFTFGNPKENAFIKNIIIKFYQFFQNDNSIKKYLLFKEWEKLFKISEEYKKTKEEISKRRSALSKIFDMEISNEENESKALFVLHNVLSIIIKLLIYNNFEKTGYLDKFDFSSLNDIQELKHFMQKLEHGEVFNRLGVYNLTIYDFFSWYTDEHIAWDNNIKDLIYTLIQEINKFIPLKNLSNSVDYVEELYRSYIPKEIRHSFGEFFTPHVVASLVVNNIAKIEKDDKVIDPTCGSGTFLIEVLKVKKEKSANIKEILKTICGIDLNPINVILAKFNIITNLLDILKDNKLIISNLIVPVFIGDSSCVPEITKHNGIDIIKYNWIFPISEFQSVPEIVLPVEFVKSNQFFDIIQKVKEYIEEDIGTTSKDEKASDEKASNFLISKIQEYEKEINKKLLDETLINKIKEWINFIRKYHKSHLNSIWLFTFINYIYPFAIAPYDKVIGNPPWVRWSNLPSFYKEKVKKTLREKGLFSSDKNTGGIDLNIYGLITYNALVYLLDKGKTLSFLLPTSSLQNKSLEGFRKLCMHVYGKIIEPIYFSKGKIFEEIGLDFIIIKIERK